MLIREKVPLAPLTTLGVGGAARFYAAIQDEGELLEALDFASNLSLPTFVLGGGSNLLVSDAGFEGLVLHVRLGGVNYEPLGDRVRMISGAGEEWDAVVERSVARRLAGLETLSGIPGSVGGTPVQNVGAYGAEARQWIDYVDAVAVHGGATHRFAANECGFGYRQSRFNGAERGQYVILRVAYLLEPDGEPTLGYSDIQRHFADRRQPPSLAETRAAVLEIRRRKSMVYDERDLDSHSAGSFFKNPVLNGDEAKIVVEKARALGLEPTVHAAEYDQFKLSAAWLIEKSGVEKGFRMGKAAVSSKHTLALTNRGGATAAEVLALKVYVQEKVFTTFGITLHPEPVMVGFE